MVLTTFCSSALTTNAENTKELNSIYKYTNEGFTFEKVSHVNTPVENPDGIVDYLGQGVVGSYVDGESELGNGDRGQSYSYASATYGDWGLHQHYVRWFRYHLHPQSWFQRHGCRCCKINDGCNVQR